VDKWRTCVCVCVCVCGGGGGGGGVCGGGGGGGGGVCGGGVGGGGGCKTSSVESDDPSVSYMSARRACGSVGATHSLPGLCMRSQRNQSLSTRTTFHA
jgi:hypothetical protein